MYTFLYFVQCLIKTCKFYVFIIVDKVFYLLMLLKRLLLMYVKSFLVFPWCFLMKIFSINFVLKCFFFVFYFLLNYSLMSCFNFMKSDKTLEQGDLTLILNGILINDLTRYSGLWALVRLIEQYSFLKLVFLSLIS